MLTLEDWREDRTMFDRATTNWGITESAVSRISNRVEDIFSDSQELTLPAKRQADFSPEIEIVVVTVAETKLERAKKNNVALIRAKKAASDKNASWGWPKNAANH